MKYLILITLMTSSLVSFAQETIEQLELPRITQRSSRTELRTKWDNILLLPASFLLNHHDENIPIQSVCQFDNDVPADVRAGIKFACTPIKS